MGNALGPDVSFYQDDASTPQRIDFKKMNQAADYVIIRAGQNLWPDRDIKHNWSASKAAGLPRGSYWFYDSRAEPKRQAEKWVETLDGDLGELPMFADIEETYGGQYAGWRKWYDFLERLKELVGQKEIAIYTAYYYWRDNAPNPDTEPQNLEYFHQYPLWIANYNVTTPRVPKPWDTDEWLFWQFTESGDGELYGVESKEIDLNYFNGDAVAFRERFGLDQPPPGAGEKYRVELSIRDAPGMDEDVIGTLEQDEVLEVLDVTDDKIWLQIKREDGTPGWIFNTHLIKVASPPQDKWYRVTADVLNVRSGPGTDYDDIGNLYRDEVVKALDYANNDTWIKIIRESDGLTGWSFAAYLEETTEPPDELGWYRVTASVLNVREGPSTSDTVVGSLPFNSVIKGLEKNYDGTWIKILRESDDLTGWCSAAFLEETNEPPPTTELKNWYEVNATTLNVRKEPNASSEGVGYVSNGQVLLGLETNADKTWVRIQRFDGLVGWASAAYLTDLGTTAPEKLVQRIFPSVVYYRQVMQSPRKMVAHVLAIDTQASGLKGLVTPPSHESGLICTRKTSKFLEEFSLQVAINGDGFSYLDPDEYDPQEYCPNGGDPVKINSYAASRGNVYSERWSGRPILYVNRNLKVSFNEPTGAIYNAVSGDRMLVEKGQKVEDLEDQSVEPRSAAGTNSNGRWLFLVVIDGRQPGYSEGITFPELADFMISLGVYNALNLDGGGSSALVIEGALGGSFVLNSPIEGNIPGNESEVGNHLGFWVKK
ncbi:MAG: SH3 domain-containing protein [Anaerolineales bacterium]|jgi:GH25 family lysozyme M1 (1,4-beta-N-acetylmuramidase)/uncharacterized protein YgiM (DUF1202 family)